MKNLKHLFAATLLLLPFVASAVPAYPGIITRTNPDGTTVELRVYGDEFFNYVTNTDNVVMQKNENGFWLPVIKNGVELVATPEVVNEMQEGSQMMKMRQNVNIQRVAALDNNGRTTYPTIGDDIHSLVVLMEYADTKFTIPNVTEEFNNWLNQENYSGYNAVGSVRDYYIASSNGLFKPVFDIAPIIVSLPEKSVYYTAGDQVGRFNQALKFAVETIDDVVDFTKYDYDNDGVIDTIYFIYAGFGQADTLDETTIWPHQGSMAYYNITLDGKQFGPYATSNELCGICYGKDEPIIDGIGAFAHEYGHVLGLPDLYDPAYNKSAVTPGYWSVMDAGSYNLQSTCPPLFSAYEKWLCKWLEYEDIADNTSYELLSMDQQNRAIKIPVYRRGGESLNPNEYFLLEARSQNGWDSGFSDSGLLIWHVDYQVNSWRGNTVNSVPSHPRCYLVSADGTGNPFTNNLGSAKMAPWPGKYENNTFISPDTEITLDMYTSGAVNNHFITSIAYDYENNISTFDFNVITEAPDYKTIMLQPVGLLNDRGRKTKNIRLSWEPLEGAECYFLTVYRLKEDGTKLYLGGCNELKVGTDTEYEIKNISDYLMDSTHYAYVRVCKGLPSSEISNEVEFVINDLEYVSGINDIFVDDNNDNAPVEYFNLQGIRVDNPENGLFIRRQGNKVEKIIL